MNLFSFKIFEFNVLSFFRHLNDTRREKLCFIQFNTRMAGWLLLTFFICLDKKSFHYQYRCLKNVVHQVGSANEWLLLSASFNSKIWVSFGLNNGEWFLLEVEVSDQLKEHRFFHKAALWIFKIAVRLRDQQVFMWRSVKTLNIFSTSNLKQIFQKTITFFKKLQYCFLVWGTRSKTHHFRTKLPYLQPMLRQIQWWPQNGPITKNGVFPVTTLSFLESCFSFKNLL